MDPYQAPTPGPNQYDFIMNSQQQPKKPLLGGSGMRQRLLVVIGGALVLMLILSLFTMLISSGGGDTNKRLRQLALEQEEIIRIATIGAQEARDINTRSFAITTKLSVSSHQQDVLAYLESKNIKFKNEQLSAGRNTETDKELEQAKDRNKFDETFNEILKSEVATYANNLEVAYSGTKNKAIRDFLGTSYTSAALLINPELASE
jgi:hypothetical protein